LIENFIKKCKLAESSNTPKPAKSIGHYFNIDNSAYCNAVINLLSTGKHNDIISALTSYFPPEIPR
jgi:hypothetical protein